MYNSRMDVLMTLATRIGKKTIALEKDKNKVTNLKTQIEMYERSIVKTEEDMGQKQEEIDLLLDLKLEAEPLVKKRDELQAYTDGLRAKFDAIEWSPDMPWSDRIESTDYQEKVDERHAINARLTEIEKIANKTYFRR